MAAVRRSNRRASAWCCFCGFRGSFLRLRLSGGGEGGRGGFLRSGEERAFARGVLAYMKQHATALNNLGGTILRSGKEEERAFTCVILLAYLRTTYTKYATALDHLGVRK